MSAPVVFAALGRARRAGAKKSELEWRYLERPQSHGKLFSTLVREHLGYETERRSNLASERDKPRSEVRRLRALVERNGIDPEKER